MNRIIRILILFTFIHFNNYAQGESNNWYFGENAGLSFNNGAPEVLLNSSLSTTEGCATISNANGDLLFYTDGITVYNKNHNIMLNGTGLLGHPSSTNSAIIIPKPEDSNIYYIFTLDQEAQANGFRYSEVNISLDGGLGAINTQKNILLQNTINEKISAIKNEVTNEYWVVVHRWNSNEFLSYKITNNGIDLSPIISATGSLVQGGHSSIGDMKISPNGERIAVARYQDLKEIQLFDFNINSGIVSNPLTLASNLENFYGIEFSPNSTILYASAYLGSLFQYNLNAGSNNDIINSVITLSNNSRTYGTLQLAVDGKIYIAVEYETTLDIINNPNIAGFGCNYQENAISLDGRTCTLGLPPFIQSDLIYNIQYENTCFGDNTLFSISEYNNIASWNFGDPDSGVNNTSAVLNPSHVFTHSGTFLVSAIITVNGQNREITKNVIINSTPTAYHPDDFVVCQDDINTLSATFDLSLLNNEVLGNQNSDEVTISFHHSQLAAEANTNPISTIFTSENTTIFIRVENNSFISCFDITTVELIVTQLPFINQPNEVESCYQGSTFFDLNEIKNNIISDNNLNDISISFHHSENEAVLNTSPLTNDYLTDTSETIFIRLENNQFLNCYFISSISLKIVERPILIDEIVTICNNSTVTLSAESGYDSYLWSTGEISETITVDQTGFYEVVVTTYYNTVNCEETKTIQVVESEIDNLFTITTHDLTRSHNKIMINMENVSNYEFSIDGFSFQNSPVFINLIPKTYNVYIKAKNGCGLSVREITLLNYPHFFTPNNDGFYDYWKIPLLEKEPNSYLYIFNRFGKVLFKMNSNSRGWDGIYNSGLLIPTDYWFILYRDNKKPFQGHFSLIK